LYIGEGFANEYFAMATMSKTAKLAIIFSAIGIAVGIGIAFLIGSNNQNREMMGSEQQTEGDVNAPQAGRGFNFYNAKYPSALAVGEKGAFFAFSSGGKEPYTFQWKFSDGVTLTGENVTRSFASPGTYNFVLTVTDALGRQVKSTDLSIQVLQEMPKEQGEIANSTSTPHN
jgi:PKD domain